MGEPGPRDVYRLLTTAMYFVLASSCGMPLTEFPAGHVRLSGQRRIRSHADEYRHPTWHDPSCRTFLGDLDAISDGAYARAIVGHTGVTVADSRLLVVLVQIQHLLVGQRGERLRLGCSRLEIRLRDCICQHRPSSKVALPPRSGPTIVIR